MHLLLRRAPNNSHLEVQHPNPEHPKAHSLSLHFKLSVTAPNDIAKLLNLNSMGP